MELISGFLVGLVVGMTGVGGGSLMTPLLIFIFGVSPASAVGTDLLFASITKMGGAYWQAKHDLVEWRIVKLLAMGSMPASLGTLWWLQGIEVNFTPWLGTALILTAVAILFRKQIVQDRSTRSYPDWITVTAGAGIGLLVTVTSVGAGALGTVALFLLYRNIATVRLIATDIAHAVPLTLIAGLGHWQLGNVNWVLLGWLLAGSLPGIWLGTRLGRKLPEQWLRGGLVLLLLLVGVKLVAA